MTLSGNVALLATRIATEFKTLRSQVAAAYSPINHTHSTPLVPNAPVTLTYSSSITPVATAGNYQVCTATGSPTLNPPSSPANGQMLRIRFIASGGARTVTLSGSFRRPSHIPVTLDIPSGRRGDIGLLYETADGAWTVLAAQAA